MTTLEQIQALALQGIGKAAIEATIGHPLDGTEQQAFLKARTARRLKRALDAQKDQCLFGGGFLVSQKAAAEKAAAKVWQLSERERAIIDSLGQ